MHILILAILISPLLGMSQGYSVQALQEINNTEGGLTSTPLDNYDYFGSGAAVIGDVDHDGIDDIAVGAYQDDDGVASNHGAVYILMLNADGTVKAQQKISNTEGNGPYLMNGHFYFGVSVTALGDLNGDGNVDIAVGCYGGGNTSESGYKGAVYILFLDQTGSVLSHTKISNTEGGGPGDLVNYDYFGIGVNNIGDLNGDGIPDLAIGALGNDDGGTNVGAVYIAFLDYNGTAKSIQKISATSGGFTGGLSAGDTFFNATSVGDLDGDGVGDLAIGTRGYDGMGTDQGALWICFMNADGTVDSQQAINATAGGFTGTLNDGDQFGGGIISLGDMNGNGRQEIGVSAAGDDDGVTNGGALWILYLNANGTISSHTKISCTDSILAYNGKFIVKDIFGDRNNDGKIDLLTATSGVGTGQVEITHLEGLATYPQKTYHVTTPFITGVNKQSAATLPLSNELGVHDYYGVCSAGIGDLDDDGVADMVVGAYRDDDGGTDRGAVYVQFMNANGTIKSLQKISDTQGSFTGVLDNGDNFGISVAYLGVKNGKNTIAVGALNDDDCSGGCNRSPNMGAVWILSLNTNGTVSSYTKISETQGDFTGDLDNADNFGRSVSGIADVNNDGITDLVVGAYADDDGGSGRGAVWIIELNSSNEVGGHTKISSLTEGLTLANSDLFGIGVTQIGDINDDGYPDIAVGNHGDDSQGTDKGCIHIIKLNSSGGFLSAQKITQSTGGFTGSLNIGDHFGSNLAGGYDFDQDGVEDLILGAYASDEAGANTGSAYVILLTTEGTVKDHYLISPSSPHLIGEIDASDYFGIGMSIIDYDAPNNTAQIAIGAIYDDDGGSNVGASYLFDLDLQDIGVNPVFVIDDTQGVESFTYTVTGAGLNDMYTSGSQETLLPVIAYGETETLTIEYKNLTGEVLATTALVVDKHLNITSAITSINENGRLYSYNTVDFLNKTGGSSLSLNLTQLYSNYIENCTTNDDYNWTSQKSYDENGLVIGESMTFMDAMGRPTQSQTKNFSTYQMMAKQNIYDAFGRAAISTMSAPIYQSYFCYKPNFITANGGQAYNHLKFDLDNTASQVIGERDNPFGIDNTDKGSLGWYFSKNNNEESFVAESSFPYSRIEYYNDPLGRPKKMANTGENYKMGSGHESKVFQMDAGHELHYVYQRNIGHKQYSKTIIQDADGIEQIIYKNGRGNVVATCYSGIDNDCMDIPVQHELAYHSTRSVDIHVPNITGQELKWIYNNARNCGQKDFVEIKLYDLLLEKEMVEGTDYVLTTNNVFDFSASPIYANKDLYLRISYNYTDTYIGSNGAYYTGWYNAGQHQTLSGNLYASQTFQYALDYGNWTLNYYDGNDRLYKTIPPEGVDCNGADPSVGYASENGYNQHFIYQSSAYNIPNVDILNYNGYTTTNSPIFNSEITQSHSLDLLVETRREIINYVSTDPCDNGAAGTYETALSEENIGQTGSVTNVLLENLSRTTSYTSTRLMTSDMVEEDPEAAEKISGLETLIDGVESLIAQYATEEDVINGQIDSVKIILDTAVTQSVIDQANASIQNLENNLYGVLNDSYEQQILRTGYQYEINLLETPLLGLYNNNSNSTPPVFVQDGEIIGGGYGPYAVVGSGGLDWEPDPDPCENHCFNGVQDCGETGIDIGGGCNQDPDDPCEGDPVLVGIFHFQIELIIKDALGVSHYVQPDGSVTTTPYSYSIFPELYQTCACKYLFNHASLTSLGVSIQNDNLNNYPGGIHVNVKDVWVDKNTGNFVAFDPADHIHNMAQYLHFITSYEHHTSPNVNDNVSHSMESTYSHNPLNQIIDQTNPDEGLTEYNYDTQGKMRFAQNAQQKIDKNFTYINYDRAGRPIESGVYDYTNIAALQFQNYNELPTLSTGTSVLTVIDEQDGLLDTYCSEQVNVLYDVADVASSPDYPFTTSPYTTYEQEYLLGRVSKTWNDNSTTWFSYDMYGRVIWTIEYIRDVSIAAYKTMHYEYDAAGNIKKSIYQKDDDEYFEHRYTYDSGQQLSLVETSRNGVIYYQQADYNYYQHGALKRTELGNKLQGIDYVYTLEGKLKAINSPNLGALPGMHFVDPGNDSPGNNGVYTDIFGMTIDYHTDDYKREGTYINYGSGNNQNFTGTINAVRWNLDAPALNTNLAGVGKQNIYEYQYNAFNWLEGATFGDYVNGVGQNNNVGDILLPGQSSTPIFTADANSQFKVSNITYDKNGNIETLKRNGNLENGIAMDDFTYNYATTTQAADGDIVKTNNRLTFVADAVIGSAYTTDIETQAPNNYTYNANGELTANALENRSFTYYQNGLAKEVKTGVNMLLKFTYNANGKRIKKEVYDGVGGTTPVKEMFYIRDLSGAIVSTYERDVQQQTMVKDYTLFGGNQLGMYDPATMESRFHMYDHLGNVRATIRKNGENLEVLSANEFYPFGSTMPARTLISSVNKVNYGYQGQELDETGLNAFALRMYDPRLGRWLRTDPYYQHHSPYMAMSNNPISFIDPTGGSDFDGDNIEDTASELAEWGYGYYSGDAWMYEAQNNNGGLEAEYEDYDKYNDYQTLMSRSGDLLAYHPVEITKEAFYAYTDPRTLSKIRVPYKEKYTIMDAYRIAPTFKSGGGASGKRLSVMAYFNENGKAKGPSKSLYASVNGVGENIIQGQDDVRSYSWGNYFFHYKNGSGGAYNQDVSEMDLSVLNADMFNNTVGNQAQINFFEIAPNSIEAFIFGSIRFEYLGNNTVKIVDFFPADAGPNHAGLPYYDTFNYNVRWGQLFRGERVARNIATAINGAVIQVSLPWGGNGFRIYFHGKGKIGD